MCLSGPAKESNGVCGMIQPSERSWMRLMGVMRSSPIITRYGEVMKYIFVVIAQLAVCQLTGSKDRDGMSL